MLEHDGAAPDRIDPGLVGASLRPQGEADKPSEQKEAWVLISLVLTVIVAGVLLLHMPDVSALADAAREAGEISLEGPRRHLYTRLDNGDILHPALGLAVLLVIQVLNVYKPQGMTRHGWRKQEEHRKELQRSKQEQQQRVLQR